MTDELRLIELAHSPGKYLCPRYRSGRGGRSRHKKILCNSVWVRKRTEAAPVYRGFAEEGVVAGQAGL